MSLRECLAVALDALWANRLRSLLTTLGIVIGVAAVIAVVAIGRGGQALVLGELESIGAGTVFVQPDWMSYGGDMRRVQYLTDYDLRAIRALPGVVQASPEIDVTVTAKLGRETRALTAQGVDAAYPLIYGLRLARGRFFTEEEAVIGEEAEEEFYGAGRALGQVVRVNGFPFVIVGVAERSRGLFAQMGMLGALKLFVPYTALQRVTGEEEIAFLSVRPVAAERAREVEKAVQAWVDGRHGPGKFKVQSLDQMVEAVRRVTDILTAVIGGIAAIALLVGGIGIMNIMLVSVTERTREVGIRMALGARRKDILRQFLLEAVALSLVGGLLGMALGGALAVAAGKILKLPALFTWSTALLAVAVSTAVGVVFGVYPASRAAGLDPVEALRHE